MSRWSRYLFSWNGSFTGEFHLPVIFAFWHSHGRAPPPPSCVLSRFPRPTAIPSPPCRTAHYKVDRDAKHAWMPMGRWDDHPHRAGMPARGRKLGVASRLLQDRDRRRRHRSGQDDFQRSCELPLQTAMRRDTGLCCRRAPRVEHVRSAWRGRRCDRGRRIHRTQLQVLCERQYAPRPGRDAGADPAARASISNRLRPAAGPNTGSNTGSNTSATRCDPPIDCGANPGTISCRTCRTASRR